MEHWLDLDQDNFQIDGLNKEKAFEIVIGERKEPSIIEAIHDNYAMQMDCYKKYSPYLPMLFLKHIQDTDICIEFLGLKMYRNPNHKYSVEALLKFLQINYSDKQILDFFSNIKKNDLYSSIIFGKLASNISRLDSLEDFFTEFKNTKCTLQDLHNAVVDCLRRSNEKHIRGVKIEMLPSHLEPCGKMDDYEVKIIQSGDELIDWSDYLKNDIFLDLYAIINHKTQIYGFFKDSNLKFIVRINNACNITSRAFNNDQLKTEEEALKDKWICQFFAPKKDSDRIPLEIIY